MGQANIDSGKVNEKALNVDKATNKRNEVPEKESQKGPWLLCDPKESIKNRVKQQLRGLLG